MDHYHDHKKTCGMMYEQAHSCTKDNLCHYTELLYPKCKIDSATIKTVNKLI
jgi:hypothetical protein